MSDSDSNNDILPNNVFRFQNESTTLCARGPNTTASNITNFSFRNNILTSTMNMPRNFERQRYAQSNYDQRSMYYGRETSPMSIHSACDVRPRNFNHSYYARGMSSGRSVVNGRSGSPMSMRSMDSTASVSATDIAMAFKNAQFNKYDLKIIKEAYNKLMKHRVRKKIEKRRNLRLFLKGYRRKSGDDSGEQGSDSSISSDDCRSTKRSTLKENMSSCRSTNIDLTDMRIRNEHNIYKEKDKTDVFKNNNFKMPAPPPPIVKEILPKPIQTSMTQKDRFKSGFLLPSHRFNRTVAETTIHENVNNSTKVNRIKGTKNEKPKNYDNRSQNNQVNSSESDQEEIFSEVTVRENSQTGTQGKRSIDSVDDIEQPQQKKSKINSPKKKATVKNHKPKSPVKNNKNNNEKDFEFTKPTFPVKKLNTKEKLISKSAQPLDTVQVPRIVVTPIKVLENNDKALECNKEPEISQNASDMSMRPSFIKRKLFTQRLDVTEKKNVSIDSIGANSPQNSMYGALQKEKHKARKLVTSQSCLSRDVQEDSNLLDLIHKIVPPDRINVTNHTNKTESVSQSNIDNSEDASEKWDVTSILSTCQNVDVSDTYTDEEIFEADNTKCVKDDVPKKTMKGANTVQSMNTVPAKDCRIVVEKLPINTMLLNQCKNNGRIEQKAPKKNLQPSVKSFWDTDFESDFEYQATPQKKNDIKIKINNKIVNHQNKDVERNIKNISVTNKAVLEIPKQLNITMDNSQRFSNTSLQIRTHRTPKRKKDAEPHKTVETKEPQSKIQKTKHNTTNKNQPNNLAKSNLDSTLNSTMNNQTANESGNNSRSLRSCRKAKLNNTSIASNKNVSINNNSTINNMSRTLRSRQIDLSSSTNSDTVGKNKQKRVKNNTKSPPKISKSKAQLSDVSFSLADCDPKLKTTKAKKAALNRNLSSLRNKDNETSDVSFNLNGVIESPVRPKSSKSKPFSKVNKVKQTDLLSFVKKSPASKRRMAQNNEVIVKAKTDSKPTRIKIPNKKYQIR